MTIEQTIAEAVCRQLSSAIQDAVKPLHAEIAQLKTLVENQNDREEWVRQIDLPARLNISLTRIKELRRHPDAPKPNALGLFSVREWREFIAKLPKIAA